MDVHQSNDGSTTNSLAVVCDGQAQNMLVIRAIAQLFISICFYMYIDANDQEDYVSSFQWEFKESESVETTIFRLIDISGTKIRKVIQNAYGYAFEREKLYSNPYLFCLVKNLYSILDCYLVDGSCDSELLAEVLFKNFYMLENLGGIGEYSQEDLAFLDYVGDKFNRHTDFVSPCDFTTMSLRFLKLCEIILSYNFSTIVSIMKINLFSGECGFAAQNVKLVKLWVSTKFKILEATSVDFWQLLTNTSDMCKKEDISFSECYAGVFKMVSAKYLTLRIKRALPPDNDDATLRLLCLDETLTDLT
jgi:hypothetical protein